MKLLIFTIFTAVYLPLFAQDNYRDNYRIDSACGGYFEGKKKPRYGFSPSKLTAHNSRDTFFIHDTAESFYVLGKHVKDYIIATDDMGKPCIVRFKRKNKISTIYITNSRYYLAYQLTYYVL